MRRAVALLLALSILRSALPAPAVAQQGADLVPAEALAALLEARELKNTRNPVVASFLAGEGAALVPKELRERALQQLRGALKGQTNFMGLLFAGMGGVMGSDAMKQQQAASQMSSGKFMAGAYLGISPVTGPAPTGDEMQREMQEALTDPWVRGIEAAAALDQLGDGNAAARFYVECLAFLPEDWVPAACLEGILGLGPERAERLLSWMLAEAESITEPSPGEASAGSGGIPSLDSGQTGKKARKGDPLPGTVQIRSAALARALAEGPGNDCLVAWTQVALLELGDLSQLTKVEAALGKEDWQLDPRGFRSIWRAISPFLQAAAGVLLTGGVGAMTAFQQIWKAVQLVGNFAAGERTSFLARVDARQGATAQLRWQAADAIAAAQVQNAAVLLERLLEDSSPPVRMSAALALAELPDPRALDGLVRAFVLDYGAENGVPRTPEVRAALLRAAWLRNADAPATREMARLASSDPDGAVRFIGWAMLRPAA